MNEKVEVERKVLMTTQKIVIDADDPAHAEDLYDRLRNDGFRVQWEMHHLVQTENGGTTIDIEKIERG